MLKKLVNKIICLVKGHKWAYCENPIAWNDGDIKYEYFYKCLRCEKVEVE